MKSDYFSTRLRMADIGDLYKNAFLSSIPGYVFILLGVFTARKRIVSPSSQQYLSALCFKICLAVKSIYSLSFQRLSSDDWLLVLALVLCAIISLIVIIPFSVIAFPKGSRFLPCSSLMIVVFLNNVVACSLPAIGGLYEDVNVEKYAYLQILAGSGITYAPVYFCFELDATLRKMSEKAISRH